MSGMSRQSSKYGGHNSDRDRRQSSSGRRDHRGRSSSPGPSRPRPRNADELPESFGGGQGERDRDEDLNILQRMKSSYVGSPLSDLLQTINSDTLHLKVWTRNYKEVRGICTGYLIAFDKHWNLVMRETDEVFLKSRKSKTPFLRDLNPGEDIPEMPPRVPRVKKTDEERAQAEARAAAERAERAAAAKPGKKPRRKKKRGPTTQKRHFTQFFIRGDNIVMIAVVEQKLKDGGDDSDREGATDDEPK